MRSFNTRHCSRTRLTSHTVFCAVLCCRLWVVIREQFRRIPTARRNNDGAMTLNGDDDDGGGRHRVNIGKPFVKLKLLIRGGRLYFFRRSTTITALNPEENHMSVFNYETEGVGDNENSVKLFQIYPLTPQRKASFKFGGYSSW